MEQKGERNVKAKLNPNYGLYHDNRQAFCDSLQIAETFGRQHKHILDTVDKLNQPTSGLTDEFRTHNFEQTYYKDSQGRKQRKYMLTKDGFVMVTMEFKTAKARQFKEAYIKRFNDMAEYITALNEVRNDFPEFTAAVRLAHDEPKPYHYANEISMLYSLVLGQSVPSFKRMSGIEGENIRDCMSAEQLRQFKILQRIDIGLLIVIKDMAERKRILHAQHNAHNAEKEKGTYHYRAK